MNAGLSSPHIGRNVSPPVTQSYDDWISEQAWIASRSPLLSFRPLKERSTWGVTYAKGGNLVKLVVPRSKGLHRGGGARGQVTSFTPESRLRLLRMFNSIDRTKIDPVTMWMVTLTYPAEWSREPARWKKDLKAFRKRLEAAWGQMAVVWKLEAQRRGAPHFHLINFMPAEHCRGMERVGSRWHNGRLATDWTGGRLAEFREWVSVNWAAVIRAEPGERGKRANERAASARQALHTRRKPDWMSDAEWDHLRAGTSVEPLQSWQRTVSYAAKYVGKVGDGFRDENGDPLAVGRLWGVWRDELIPISLQAECVRQAAWFRFRRQVLRYCERQSGGRRRRSWDGRGYRSITAFVPAEIVERLGRWADPLWGRGDLQIACAELLEADRRHQFEPSQLGCDMT